MMDRERDVAGSSAAGPVVLVVDDNIDNQELLAYLLTSLGVRTDIASNGIEAVAAFGRTGYAAVFMDCEMPQMDGFQATAALRRLEPPGAGTRILALTAHPVRDVRERCLAAGMDDCLSKPVGAEELRVALAAILPEQGRPVAPAVTPTDAAGEVDLNALAGLGQQIGADVLRDVLETFWEETGKRLARLSAAVAAGDSQEAAAAAHAIKGGSASLGYVRVAELSNEVQHLAEAGAIREAAERTAALAEAFGRARAGGAQLLATMREGAGAFTAPGLTDKWANIQKRNG
jgi:CheY-like chemotaxis protein/HPt (histidine-containing phosphotransfer) domain-containing protein